MSIQEIIKTSFFVTIWLFTFQIATGLLLVAVKRTLRQFLTSREVKKGQTRCRQVFHCHCEKMNGESHGKMHVNETNMVVWE